MAHYSTTGITLQHHSFGEYDKVLVLFTADRGVIRVVAKGARRPHSKLGGQSEPLNMATWFLGKGKRMDVVAQVEPIHAHRALRTDLDRLVFAMYLAELTSACLDEGQPHPEVFTLFASALRTLELAESPELVAAWYELALAGELGYAPQLDACSRCREPVEPGPGLGFSAESGGVVCSACGAVAGGANLPAKTLLLLRRLRAVELPALIEHRLEPALVASARSALRNIVTLRCERPLRSLKVLMPQ